MRPRSFSFKPVIFLTLFLTLSFIAIKLRNVSYEEMKIISPLLPEKPLPQNPQELLTTLKKILEEKGGTYSFYFEDLNSGEAIGINEQMIVVAASVNKIPILASLYYLAGQGKIDLEKKITIQKRDIQNYGTGVIRYQEPGQVYSLKTLARLMMEKSDNTASYILGSQVIGLSKIQELINFWGLTQTDMEENKTSNKDMAKLMKLMFQGKIAKPALTLEMMGFMDDSDFEDRLPSLLPVNIDVYHKTGNEIGFVHDIGIVNLPDRPYYLGILTSDISNEDEVIKTIAEISKIIFDYQSQ